MATAIMLVYLTGRERWIYDSVQMERRLELEELARDLSFQATTDPLTGINNRLKFDQLLHQEIGRAERYGTPLSLVLYDLDHFKLINDTHGHPVGDEVLAEISQLASNHIRRTDFVARWGGEEFAILVPQGDSDSAFRLARSLRDAVRDQTFAAGATVTCSFGVAEFIMGETAQSFVARADTALYRAKLNGRNRVELAPTAASGKAGLRVA
jgi:diguanylate cyclase (GGDEF)-like protein